MTKRVEVTQVWARSLRFWLDNIEEKIKEIYRLEKREVPSFMLMCIGLGARDE